MIMLKNIKPAATKIARFFRLIDRDNKLSLTNLAVMLALFKFATAEQAISPLDFGALLTTMLSYQGKKLIDKVKDPNAGV